MFALGETLGIGALFFMGSVLWPRRSTLKMAVVVLGITILKIAAFLRDRSRYTVSFVGGDAAADQVRRSLDSLFGLWAPPADGVPSPAADGSLLNRGTNLTGYKLTCRPLP